MAAGGAAYMPKDTDRPIRRAVDAVDDPIMSVPAETKAADDVDAPTKRPFKVKVDVKKIEAFATWSFVVSIDRCSICRSSIFEPSIENQATGSSEVTIHWGLCNHGFHMECVARWLTRNNSCPLCGRDWELQKQERVSG